jgi:hypothetical protein
LKAEENDFAFSQSDRYGLQKAEIIYLGRKS